MEGGSGWNLSFKNGLVLIVERVNRFKGSMLLMQGIEEFPSIIGTIKSQDIHVVGPVCIFGFENGCLLLSLLHLPFFKPSKWEEVVACLCFHLSMHLERNADP